jgi:hypothetical protein
MSQGFDLRTHIRDPKTGQVIKKQPYKLYIGKFDGSNVGKFYERPVGSGNLFYENGAVAGRMVDGKVNHAVPHVAVVSPKSQEQQLADEGIAQEFPRCPEY